MKSFVFIALAITLFACPVKAHVRRGEDMFKDSVWSSYERPFVMSDLRRGQDLFPAVPVMLNPRAELFQNVKRSSAFGSEDMFSKRYTRPAPHYSPLFNEH